MKFKLIQIVTTVLFLFSNNLYAIGFGERVYYIGNSTEKPKVGTVTGIASNYQDGVEVYRKLTVKLESESETIDIDEIDDKVKVIEGPEDHFKLHEVQTPQIQSVCLNAGGGMSVNLTKLLASLEKDILPIVKAEMLNGSIPKDDGKKNLKRYLSKQELRAILALLESEDQNQEEFSLDGNLDEVLPKIVLAIEAGEKKSKKYHKLAQIAFTAKNYDLVKKLSRKEYEQFPLVNLKGFKFRLTKKTDALRLKDKFADVAKVSRDDNFVYFSKIVSRKPESICSIQKVGLDSKYGGLGGASARLFQETNGKYGWELMSEQDRGKMFFANSAGGMYEQYFKNDGLVLKIRIPLSETGRVNLAEGLPGEWFSAGGSVPPEYLFVADSGLPLSSLPCEEI